MNKSLTIRSILGFTQKELAAALNVKCSELSQFEHGNQKLTTEAAHLLHQFHKYVQYAESDRVQRLQENPSAYEQKKVERDIRRNESERLVLMSKIERAKRLYENEKSNFNILKIIYNKDRPDAVGLVTATTFKAFRERELCIYQISLKVLRYERARLEEALQRIKTLPAWMLEGKRPPAD